MLLEDVGVGSELVKTEQVVGTGVGIGVVADIRDDKVAGNGDVTKGGSGRCLKTEVSKRKEERLS